jgi:hypothetical protein
VRINNLRRSSAKWLFYSGQMKKEDQTGALALETRRKELRASALSAESRRHRQLERR